MEIRVENLCKSYHGKPVLNRLNLTFLRGEKHCLMAPSGYGKTTLLHIMMGLDKPDSGAIYGLERMRLSPVFQEDRLCENLSVGANIRLASGSRLGEERVAECLNALGLPGLSHKPVRELSSGMKRRVAIARALLNNGDLFIMDEPFKGLDKDIKKQVITYIKHVVEGKTLIWVTHEEEEGRQLGGQLIHLLPSQP